MDEKSIQICQGLNSLLLLCNISIVQSSQNISKKKRIKLYVIDLSIDQRWLG